MALLEVRGIDMVMDGLEVLRGVSFRVCDGEIACLLGPSGCGKTTLLRVIAGLEEPDAGSVIFSGRDMKDVPPHRRNFGLMFQDFALFPHMSVAQNVAFGLRMRGMEAAAVGRMVADALRLVGMAGFEERDVNELSGGERQRIALARSLAPRPDLLMLDEPISSLDRTLREQLLLELAGILKGAGVTTIYVTHDQAEAFALADRVVVMNVGRVEQVGSPREIYGRPASAFVASFVGLTNVLEGEVLPGGEGETPVDTPIGRLALAAGGEMPPPGSRITLLIRPDAAVLHEKGGKDLLRGRVAGCSFRGRYCIVSVVVRGTLLRFDLPGDYPAPPADAEVAFSLRPGAVVRLGA